MNEYEIVKQDYHRNGVGGEGFRVALVLGTGEDAGRTFLVVMFESGEYRTAAFDFELLCQGVIGFGSNSWRGDHFDSALRERLWKQHEGEIDGFADTPLAPASAR